MAVMCAPPLARCHAFLCVLIFLLICRHGTRCSPPSMGRKGHMLVSYPTPAFSGATSTLQYKHAMMPSPHQPVRCGPVRRAPRLAAAAPPAPLQLWVKPWKLNQRSCQGAQQPGSAHPPVGASLKVRWQCPPTRWCVP